MLSSTVVLSTSATLFFFFNDTATTEIYTLSLHDALPISRCTTFRWRASSPESPCSRLFGSRWWQRVANNLDRKSTRLNSSHGYISYAVFCLKKKKITYSRHAYIFKLFVRSTTHSACSPLR